MSEGVYRELVARMAADPAFAEWVRANPAALTGHFDLTEAEASSLATLGAEPAAAGAGAGAAPSTATALGTRRSRSSVLAVGGLAAAVAVGGGTDATITALRNQGGSNRQARP